MLLPWYHDHHVSLAMNAFFFISQTELKEECQVHSQPEKVSVLEELSSKFLGLSCERSYPYFDAHYGLLLFLLSLSKLSCQPRLCGESW